MVKPQADITYIKVYKMIKWPYDQTLELFISPFPIFISFCNFFSMLGANLNSPEDRNCKSEGKYCQRGDKIVKEEIKGFQSLTPCISA